MIAREEARLRNLFQRLLIVSLAAAPAACSSSSGSDTTDGSVQGSRDSGGGGDDSGGATTDATLSRDTGGGGGDDGGVLEDSSACNTDFVDGADDGSGCEYFYNVPCGLAADAAIENCFLPIAECQVLCHQSTGHNCYIVDCLNQDATAGYTPPPGPLEIECKTGLTGCAPGAGRRPDGLTPAACVARDEIGAWLADVARLEAASVVAFRRLGEELRAHGAPRALVAAAERSARDEVRHARVTSRMARARGARPARVTVKRAREARSLEDLAIENAVEGCVRETYAALVAKRQAARASDPGIARAMVAIAEDETRHAALAWAIARWVAPRLGEEGRARVEVAMKRAIAELREDAPRATASLAREAGLPAGEEARALVDAFAASLAA
jgi:hypothetical protein